MENNISLNSKKTVAQRYIAFSLANEQFAIPLVKAKEFVSAYGLSEISSFPESKVETINLRSKNIIVLDLRKKLNLFRFETLENRRGLGFVIVINIETFNVGIKVDSISCVLSIGESEVITGSQNHLEKKSHLIIGHVKKDNRVTQILDVDALLNSDEIEIIKNISSVA